MAASAVMNVDLVQKAGPEPVIGTHGSSPAQRARRPARPVLTYIERRVRIGRSFEGRIVPRIRSTVAGVAHRRARRALPIAVAAATFLLIVGPAFPLPLPGGNVIKNPGAESGPGATSDTAVVPIPRWTTAGGFTAVRYGAGFAGGGGSFLAAPRGGGKNFFAGGPERAVATATQRINVAGSAGAIDAGKVTARLSALIGGYLDRADNGRVSATFLSAAGNALGRLTIGPVTASDRGNKTGLLPRSGTLRVPKKTRSINVVLTARRLVGSYSDAYFDNISLRLVPNG